MSLRVVLFTRSFRPSGAQMAWRLFQAGRPPVAIFVEKRGKVIQSSKESLFSLLFRLGPEFFAKRIWEAVHIRIHFYLRKFLPGRFTNPAYLSIEEWALDHPSVRVYEVEDHNSAEVRELLWRLEPDIGVLTNTRRIKKEILEVPRHGFFNLHLSALPQYAGLDSIFWALRHGEKEIGITVHSAAEEIDRGDIVLQKKILICPWDDEESLYGKALWVGTASMIEALKQLEEGRLQKRPQEGEKSYFSWPTPQERRTFRKVMKQRKEAQSPISAKWVLHFITRMTRGGAQENTLATLLGLRRKGYEVALITGRSWDKEGEILSDALTAGLPVAIFPELVRELHPWKDGITLLKVSSWLSRNRCAIIHTHTSKAGFLGRLSAWFLKVPVIIHTPHGHVFHSYFSPWKERFFLMLERQAAKQSDRLIALTERDRIEHNELGVGDLKKWLTIPSGIDTKKFQTPSRPRKLILSSLGIESDRKLVGFVGRLAPVKGARYLVEALPQIIEEVPETHCLIVGDGEEKRGLQQKVKELGLEERVTFTGHQSDPADLMSLFDVLVVPSLNEGMGRVIVEGGLLGKAVIGTKVGGIPDIIQDGETGLLIERRNSSEIAHGVMRLLKDFALSKRLGERLRKKVLAGFTEEIMIEKIHRLYQEALKEKGLSFQTREEILLERSDTREPTLSGYRTPS